MNTWVYAVQEGADPAFPAPHFICYRCGERRVIESPQLVSDFVNTAESFMSVHRKCPPPADARDES